MAIGESCILLCPANFLKRILQRVNQLAAACAIYGADLEACGCHWHAVVVGLQEVGNTFFPIIFGNQVQLVEYQPARLGG